MSKEPTPETSVNTDGHSEAGSESPETAGTEPTDGSADQSAQNGGRSHVVAASATELATRAKRAAVKKPAATPDVGDAHVEAGDSAATDADASAAVHDTQVPDEVGGAGDDAAADGNAVDAATNDTDATAVCDVESKSRPRAPRFPPGAAQPGDADLPPAFGGSLGEAVTAGAVGHSTADTSAAPDADESADETAADSETVSAPAVGSTDDGEGTSDGAGDGPRFFRRRPVIIAGAVIGGLLILYGAAYATAGSGLARNASVLGVDVGGMERGDAETLLADELPGLVNEPVTVDDGDEELAMTIVPSEAGLSIDVPATVGSIPGGTANPVSLVRALFGGGEVQPVPQVDRATLVAAVEGIGDQFDIEPVNGSVGFDDGDVVTSEAEAGSAVDVAATADLLEAEFFGAEEPTSLPIGSLTPVVAPVEPAITDAEVERAVAEFAEPAMSDSVIVTASEHAVEITPRMLSAALAMVPGDDGRLAPELEPDDLAEAAADVLAEVGQPGKDATVEIQNGAPTVIAEEVGVGIAPDALAAGLLPVLTESGDERSAAVDFEEIEPEFTTADAEALGVEEVISEFTTTFAPTSYRNTNIGLAAEKINNTLLMPGDTFSLNGLVGERTEANGFARGGVIEGGQLIQAVGGGVSQVATTTYHTAFKAGLEDVEHKPHSIYYSHYPVGQEATVSWGNFDMAFKNDTPHGVLVQTIFTPSIPNRGSLTVRLWSTEHFEVETSTSDRHSYTDPPPRSYNSSSNCVANSPSSGFSITSFRKVWDPDGELVKDESYPWTYRPSPEVVCGADPNDD